MNHKRKKVGRPSNMAGKCKGELVQEDEFSLELKAQGKMGQRFRLLYLRESMITYQKRVLDESIHY